MKITLNTKTKLILIFIITIFIFGILLVEHLHGGVASHHVLGNKDLPEISNWWGALTIPIISWFILLIIQRKNTDNNQQDLVSKSQINGFLGAFLFGIILTIVFYSSLEIHNYLLLLTFVLALFIPLYKPQFYLGFILSMAYGFGGLLPLLFGIVLLGIYAFEYLVMRQGLLIIYNKMFKYKK